MTDNDTCDFCPPFSSSLLSHFHRAFTNPVITLSEGPTYLPAFPQTKAIKIIAHTVNILLALKALSISRVGGTACKKKKKSNAVKYEVTKNRRLALRPSAVTSRAGCFKRWSNILL